MIDARRVMQAALAIGACAALAACGSAPPPPLKTAQADPAQKTANAPATPVNAPLTQVVTPAEPPRMAALARRLAAVIDGAKPQVTTFSLDLTVLPRTTMHAALDAKEAAKLDRSKLAEDPDLQVKTADGYARQYMLSFGFKDMSKVQFAHVKVNGTYGMNEGWFGEGFGTQMNAYMSCGNSVELSPIRWETVKMDNNQVTYTVNDGVLDRQSCKVLNVRKSTAVAKPLLPKGILFGFRACEGSCSENEELTVLFPRAAASAAGALGGNAERSTGSFSVVSFPIQRGGGGAFVARLMRRDALAWQVQSGDSKQPASTTPILDDASRVGAMFLSSFELGVEVSQANDDEAPVAIAYMDIDPAVLAPPPNTSSPPKAAAPVPPARVGFNAASDFDDPLESRR